MGTLLDAPGRKIKVGLGKRDGKVTLDQEGGGSEGNGAGPQRSSEDGVLAAWTTDGLPGETREEEMGKLKKQTNNIRDIPCNYHLDRVGQTCFRGEVGDGGRTCNQTSDEADQTTQYQIDTLDNLVL